MGTFLFAIFFVEGSKKLEKKNDREEIKELE